jgi:hypothetical protein
MTTTRAVDLKQQALQAFQSDLHHLHAQRPGQWVAYHGSHLIGFADQKHLLYQQCFDQGLQREEFVVFCIEPQETEIMLGSVVLDRGTISFPSSAWERTSRSSASPSHVW